METQKTLIGHPLGLFILFFTEMWERFSYYGMRVLFVLYLTASLTDGGQAWSRADASMLYGWYTGLVYITPIIGGLIADKLWGYKKAIVVGALLMTLGHAVLAIDAIPAFYTGCILLIAGNGFFK
ncbi:MAG TPA: MFS transporter, partial [Sphingobacteriaceae bacterium]